MAQHIVCVQVWSDTSPPCPNGGYREASKRAQTGATLEDVAKRYRIESKRYRFHSHRAVEGQNSCVARSALHTCDRQSNMGASYPCFLPTVPSPLFLSVAVSPAWFTVRAGRSTQRPKDRRSTVDTPERLKGRADPLEPHDVRLHSISPKAFADTAGFSEKCGGRDSRTSLLVPFTPYVTS